MATSLKSRFQFLVRVLFLARRWLPSLCVLSLILVRTARESASASSSSYKGTSPTGLQFTLMTSWNFITSLQVIPNTVTLGVRSSTYEFYRDTVQSTTEQNPDPRICFNYCFLLLNYTCKTLQSTSLSPYHTLYNVYKDLDHKKLFGTL